MARTFRLSGYWMEVCGQCHALAALPPGKKFGIHCTGGWVSPKTGLDLCEKISPYPRSDPRTVELVASRYTADAVSATYDTKVSPSIYLTKKQ